jgi:hypothetical protein
LTAYQLPQLLQDSKAYQLARCSPKSRRLVENVGNNGSLMLRAIVSAN